MVTKRMMGLTIGSWVVLMLAACAGNSKPACLHKAPVPIFEGAALFENHDFERDGMEAVERVDVPDMNLSIELYQSGCTELRQEFRILVHESYEMDTPPAYCAAHIANIFKILSEKAPEQVGPLYQWAQVILANAQQFTYNEPLLLPEMGVTVQIDKAHQTDSAILTVVLSE